MYTILYEILYTERYSIVQNMYSMYIQYHLAQEHLAQWTTETHSIENMVTLWYSNNF